MELSRDSKRIKGLIVFAALVVTCLWKYDVVVSVLAFIFHVIFPFVLGGAIAFILNVPMNFMQEASIRAGEGEGIRYRRRLPVRSVC